MMCDTPYPSIRDPAPTRRSWLSELFNRTNRARTVSMLVEAQNHDDGNQHREMLRAKISAAAFLLEKCPPATGLLVPQQSHGRSCRDGRSIVPDQ